MAYIRPFKPDDDEEDLIHVFRETAAQDLREKGDPSLHVSSFIWARPYMRLSPSYCSVIDDGTGRVVGYILGVPDTQQYVEMYERDYLPYLDDHDISKPQPGDIGDKDKDTTNMETTLRHIAWTPSLMLQKDFPDLLANYPAHLHIDILPQYQRRGFGKRLVEGLLEILQHQNVRGIHLGMVGSNDEAGKFYASLGFARFDAVMDNGVSGEKGRLPDSGIVLVKAL